MVPLTFKLIRGSPRDRDRLRRRALSPHDPQSAAVYRSMPAMLAGGIAFVFLALMSLKNARVLFFSVAKASRPFPPRRISLGVRGRAHGMPCDIVAIHQSRYEGDIRLRALYDLQLPGGGEHQRGTEKRARSAFFFFFFTSIALTLPATPALPWPVFAPTFSVAFFPAKTARS